MGQQIELIEMNEQEYKEYQDFIIEDFAGDLARNFNKPFEVAHKESKEMIERLLSEGIKTKGQYLYHIYDLTSGEKVGILWFNIKEESKAAFIYHIFIDETQRGKGYGKQALLHMEPIVKELGAKSIGLNVFGDNERAFNLYKKLGYKISATNMDKVL